MFSPGPGAIFCSIPHFDLRTQIIYSLLLCTWKCEHIPIEHVTLRKRDVIHVWRQRACSRYIVLQCITADVVTSKSSVADNTKPLDLRWKGLLAQIYTIYNLGHTIVTKLILWRSMPMNGLVFLTKTSIWAAFFFFIIKKICRWIFSKIK